MDDVDRCLFSAHAAAFVDIRSNAQETGSAEEHQYIFNHRQSTEAISALQGVEGC